MNISKEIIMKLSCVTDICTISVVENMRMDIRLHQMKAILTYVMSITHCQPRKDPSVQLYITVLDN